MSNIEKRLHNLEAAFMNYVGLTNDLLPKEYQEAIKNVVYSYDDASQEFGHDIYQVDFKGGIDNS